MSDVTTRAAARSVAHADEEKSHGVLHYLGMGISGGLFALVVLIGALVIVIPNLAGAMPLTVLTSSMEPRLPPGTLIVVKPIETEQIVVGDVITYQIKSGEPGVITHRVAGITNSSDGSRTFTLKGDNNDVADELQVLPVQVQGKLWYSVPWIGYLSNFVNGSEKQTVRHPSKQQWTRMKSNLPTTPCGWARDSSISLNRWLNFPECACGRKRSSGCT